MVISPWAFGVPRPQKVSIVATKRGATSHRPGLFHVPLSPEPPRVFSAHSGELEDPREWLRWRRRHMARCRVGGDGEPIIVGTVGVILVVCLKYPSGVYGNPPTPSAQRRRRK